MADTRRVLYGIRDTLNAPTPDIKGALQLVKDVLRQGACYEETKRFHDGSIHLLDHIMLPLLRSNRELEAVLHRYVHRINQNGTLEDADLERLLSDIDSGLEAARGDLMFPEGEPEIDPVLLEKALAVLGFDDFPKGADGKSTKSWPRIHQYLAEVIELQHRKDKAQMQENGRRGRFLNDLTAGLAGISSRLDRATDSLDQLSAKLQEENGELLLEEYSQAILSEIQGVGEKTSQTMDNLETIKHATVQLDKLFHEADNLLLETQDSDLMDAVSGMPNRYGLMARINQARVAIHEGEGRGFAVIFIGIVDLGRERKNWGRERFSSLMRWLGGKIGETGSFELYRTASEGLAVFLADSNEKRAMVQAQSLKETVLDRVIREESIPKEFHFGIGVVSFEQGMDEEAVLLAGSERMRRSILDDGKPTL